MEKKKFPIVERVIEFSEDVYIENSQVTMCAESIVSEKEWEQFEENSLVLVDGNDIYQYCSEYPIVVYCCNSDSGLESPCRLNGFIQNITISTVCEGKRFSIKKREMPFEFVGPTTVAYITDNIGRHNIISNYNIFKMLLKKPKLVLSSEGLLIFYTEKYILATNDCEHYTYVDIDTDNCIINGIEVCDECCVVSTTREDYEEDYEVRFTINMLETDIMISSSVTKI